MKYNFPYTLHDYLDRELAMYVGNPPAYVLVEKKKEYKRLYAKWYRKEYYNRIKQVTIQFNKNELTEISQKAKAVGVRLSIYIKSCLYGDTNKAVERRSMLPLVLSLRDIIEDAIHEQSLTHLAETLLIIESINTQLS